VGGEVALSVVALGVIRLWHGRVEVLWGLSARNVAAGVAVALVYAAGLIWTLGRAPDVWPIRSLRRLSRDVLQPLFAPATTCDLLVISAAAGLGEELLFRGALQPIVGLAGASALFGLCHLAGRDTVALALWAVVAGIVFGLLMQATGGLTAPIVAHAVYDSVALAYLRGWERDRSP